MIKKSGIAAMPGVYPGVFISCRSDIPDSNSKAFISQPENQEIYLIAGRQAPVCLMINKIEHGVDSMSFCREEIAVDDFIPVHKHGKEEEIIYIQNGDGLSVLDDQKYKVRVGSAAYVPKNTWHGLKNIGDCPLSMIFSFSPSGFENYFREIGVPRGTTWSEKTQEEYSALTGNMRSFINTIQSGGNDELFHLKL